MKKTILLLSLTIILCSFTTLPKKSEIVKLLKSKIGKQLPFKKVKIASIENGTGVIIDESWCYWIDSKNKIYCVNGTSKTIYNQTNPHCEDAPIKASFLDIQKIAK